MMERMTVAQKLAAARKTIEGGLGFGNDVLHSAYSY